MRHGCVLRPSRMAVWPHRIRVQEGTHPSSSHASSQQPRGHTRHSDKGWCVNPSLVHGLGLRLDPASANIGLILRHGKGTSMRYEMKNKPHVGPMPLPIPCSHSKEVPFAVLFSAVDPLEPRPAQKNGLDPVTQKRIQSVFLWGENP